MTQLRLKDIMTQFLMELVISRFSGENNDGYSRWCFPLHPIHEYGKTLKTITWRD